MMSTRLLLMVSAAIEAATGVALVLAPEVVVRLLLGAALSDAGVVAARIAGFGLLSLALACWRGDEASAQAIQALFVYNLLAGLYLGYLRVSGDFSGLPLWLACVLHILLAILFARPAYESVRQTVK